MNFGTTVISTNQVAVSDEIQSQPVVMRVPNAVRRKALNARYELAERSVELNEQFARAGGGSGRMALAHQDRATLRDRVRHEMHEADPWLKGSARSTVVSVVGRGPWLEVKIPGNPEASKVIADGFNRWFRHRVHGPRKFRAMCWGKQSDGPGLALVITDRKVKGNVKLNFMPFDDEQVRANPGSGTFLDRAKYLLDGKEFDDAGNESRYWISERHPAEYPQDESKPYDAKYVIDVWDWERPSQGRGVSPYATSVKNGPLRRSYRRATLDAATTAAKLSFLLKTNVDRFENGDEQFEDIDSLTGIPLYYGEGMALPKGWDPVQMRPEHPTTGHGEFMRDNIVELGRAAGQPGQVVMGDAQGLNFASGQLGRADWADDIDVQRQDWEDLALDKLLMHWLEEAALVGDIPREYADVDDVPHEYRWTRRRHQDTNKEYTGRAKAIATGQTSRAFWQTDDGLNPDSEDDAAAEGFGVSVAEYRRALFAATFPPLPQPEGGSNAPEETQNDSQRNGTDDGDDPPED